MKKVCGVQTFFRMKMKKTLMVLICFALLIPYLLSACGSKSIEQETRTQKVQETESVVDARELSTTALTKIAQVFMTSYSGERFLRQYLYGDEKECELKTIVSSVSIVKYGTSKRGKDGVETEFVRYKVYGTFAKVDKRFSRTVGTEDFEGVLETYGGFSPSSTYLEIAEDYTTKTNGEDFKLVD